MYRRPSAGRFGNGVTVVLSSAKIGTASWRYYTDCVACRTTEYYLGVGRLRAGGTAVGWSSSVWSRGRW